MLRIRLRRVGKKRQPYYRVVVADQPDSRDGDFIETLGAYDPHSDPPSDTVDRDKAAEWIRKGAQPSEAVAKILKRERTSPATTDTDAASTDAEAATAPPETANAALSAEAATTPAEAAADDATPAEAPADDAAPDEAAPDADNVAAAATD